MDETNFFRTLAPILEGVGSVRLVITRNDDRLIASINPLAKNIKDKAKNLIAPLVLSGTPEEIDNAFFPSIRKPLDTTQEFFTSVAEFEESVRVAKEKSDMEASKKAELRKQAEKEKKDLQENDKKVEQALTEATTDLKDKPSDALRRLEELQGKNLTLSPKVSESLIAEITRLKSIQRQTSLFGN